MPTLGRSRSSSISITEVRPSSVPLNTRHPRCAIPAWVDAWPVVHIFARGWGCLGEGSTADEAELAEHQSEGKEARADGPGQQDSPVRLSHWLRGAAGAGLHALPQLLSG